MVLDENKYGPNLKIIVYKPIDPGYAHARYKANRSTQIIFT